MLEKTLQFLVHLSIFCDLVVPYLDFRETRHLSVKEFGCRSDGRLTEVYAQNKRDLFLNGVCCRLLVFPCAGPGIFVRKTSSLLGSGREIQHYPGGPLANIYGNL